MNNKERIEEIKAAKLKLEELVETKKTIEKQIKQLSEHVAMLTNNLINVLYKEK